MIHLNYNSMLFNIPNPLYQIDKPYKCYSYIGNYVVEEFIGPSGCNSISDNKNNAIIKAFSESLERRALMLGGLIDPTEQNDKVQTIELINQDISSLPHKLTRYHTEKPMIDTTGTASHFYSESAIKNAILELLEKNALFLFWYGKRGSLIDLPFFSQHFLYNKLKNEGLKVKTFVNEDFTPVNVCITIIHDDNYIYSGGLKAGYNIQEIYDYALNEAYLLKEQNYYSDTVVKGHKNKRNMSYGYHKKCLEHLDMIEHNNECNVISTAKDYSVNELVESLPLWITNLHIFLLKKENYNSLKCVKAFSYDLHNHIPLNSRINLKTTINKKLLRLTESDLKRIPNCIII